MNAHLTPVAGVLILIAAVLLVVWERSGDHGPTGHERKSGSSANCGAMPGLLKTKPSQPSSRATGPDRAGPGNAPVALRRDARSKGRLSGTKPSNGQDGAHPDGAGAGAPDRSVPALRLSDDFQLPLAALPGAELPPPVTTVGAARPGDDGAASHPVMAARQYLIDHFYSRLADRIAAEGGFQGEIEVDAETGEETRVITPRGEAEAIRRESDERYRALFGDEAYNRRLLEAAVEKTLPPER